MPNDQLVAEAKQELEIWIARYEPDKILMGGGPDGYDRRIEAAEAIGARYGGSEPGDAEFTRITDDIVRVSNEHYMAAILRDTLGKLYRERKSLDMGTRVGVAA